MGSSARAASVKASVPKSSKNTESTGEYGESFLHTAGEGMGSAAHQHRATSLVSPES